VGAENATKNSPKINLDSTHIDNILRLSGVQKLKTF